VVKKTRSVATWRRAAGIIAFGAVASAATSAVLPASAAPADDATAVANLDDIAAYSGARDLWACGFDGSGIDVALIDTGISPVAGTGLRYAGPDLSFDAQVGIPAGLDLFGHGTHLASLINGRDPGVGAPATCRGNNGNTTTGDGLPRAGGFAGMAPGARVVNLKVGSADGAVDVTQVVAAIDWAVQYRTHLGLNIRVLALPYGTTSTSPAATDPLSHAVARALAAGIVVVAAAGNDGTTAIDLAYPARNPDVIAVGAADPTGSADVRNWTVAAFSDRGTAARVPDVFVPGVDVPGLRVPGSAVDAATTTSGDRLVRGSGTSQSAAIVAGLAAQLVDRYPSATPAQVKDMLVSSTWAARRGQVLESVPVVHADRLRKAAPRNVTASIDATTGTAPFEALRVDGTLVVDDVALQGEIDVQGRSVTGWAAQATAGTSWDGGRWLGGQYTGTPTTAGVPVATWSSTWFGSAWTLAPGESLPQWDGGKWSGGKWSGGKWSGGKWSGGKWSGGKWSGGKWSGGKWSADSWSGGKWSGGKWSAFAWS
jgi:serine protease AprX